jgi:hypothetical protein
MDLSLDDLLRDVADRLVELHLAPFLEVLRALGAHLPLVTGHVGVVA